MANQQQSLQQSSYLPIIQECVDAITEHQKLLALTKGELIKGLLPQSSIPAEYTVRRIKGEHLLSVFFIHSLVQIRMNIVWWN